MTRRATLLLMGCLTLAALPAGYRIVAHTVADALAEADPERSLRWVAGHPAALLALAERQLAAGEDTAAAASARALLRAAPLDGRALRILGEIAERAGDSARAGALYEHAARLSPRDERTRRWLIRRDVTAGNFASALAQMDGLVRVSPSHRATVLPLMAELAQLPDFVDALVPMLADNPPWRSGFLRVLHNGSYPLGADRLSAALLQAGGMDADERDRLIESLIAQNAWGKAYAYWAGSLPAGTTLPLVYNGDFAHVPTGRGFDWRIRHVPGVQVSFPREEGGRAGTARVSFRRRPVPEAGLQQPLLLAPGDYRFSARMRSEGLQSQRGLEWVIQCAAGPVVGRSEQINGSFPWRAVTMELTIGSECPGQWLKLRNRVASGSGQSTSGELWITDVLIMPVVPD